MIFIKQLLFFFLMAITCAAHAQDFPFSSTPRKQALDADDKEYLIGVLEETVVPMMNFSYSVSTGDVSPLKLEPTNAVAVSFDEIDKIKAELDTLTDSLQRAIRSLTIAQKYKKLNRSALAQQNLDAAWVLMQPLAAAHPNDSLVQLTAANTMLTANNYEVANTYFFELKKLSKDCDIFASCFIPLMYLNMGKLNEAYEFLQQSLKKWPEGEVGLYYELMVQIYSFMQLAPQRSEFLASEKSNLMPLDSIFDISKLHALHKKYPDSLKWEQFYKGASLLCLEMKIVYAINDTIEGDAKMFHFAANNSKVLNSLYVDFENIAKNKGNKNPYLAYESLGVIKFFQKDFKTAAKWFEKAIKTRTPDKSTTQLHAGEAYDNLIGCYLYMGDTFAAQKVLLKRIEARPEIDPAAKDYQALGNYYWWGKNYRMAKENYQQAIGYDSSIVMAWIGLAAIQAKVNDPKETKKLLNNSLAIKKDTPEAYLIYSIAALQEGDFSIAYSMLRAAHRNGYDEETVFEIARRFYPMEEF